jgi:hypothetical protein
MLWREFCLSEVGVLSERQFQPAKLNDSQNSRITRASTARRGSRGEVFVAIQLSKTDGYSKSRTMYNKRKIWRYVP